MNFSIQHFESLDSTNKEVLRQAKTGAKEGLTVVAVTQTAGKGRLGRTWQTIDHALAMSVLLRPDFPVAEVSKLSLLTAVALHDALSLFASEIGIKWPNDLLIEGKKVCGILTEMQQTDTGIVVVLGMGINIELPPVWDANMRTSPTSLNEHSTRKTNKEDVLQAALEALDTRYTQLKNQGFAPILQAWEDAHIAKNKEVSVYSGNTYVQGIALGLADDGSLRLLVNGEERRIIAGDVSIMGKQT
ncbi:MAG: biotin--[acetyl-CoA-carboxylase] ligase [Ghiorsea sp.]|nr:biotin--[acetyl-CoA-carboxylase] ligase [Ghiorsea sp.]